MRHTQLLSALCAVSLFISGFALGEKRQPAPFAKYQGQVTWTTMDALLLTANFTIVRDNVQTYPGIPIPHVQFDRDAQRIVAVSPVDAQILDAQPAEVVKKHLLFTAKEALADTLLYIDDPSIFGDGFEVEFRSMRQNDKGLTEVYNYAEFKNGKLTLH